MTTQILNFDDDRLAWEATMIQVKGHQIYHEQDLHANQYVELMKRFGDCESPDLFMNPKKNPEIFIVTGKKDKHGKKLGMLSLVLVTKTSMSSEDLLLALSLIITSSVAFGSTPAVGLRVS